MSTTIDQATARSWPTEHIKLLEDRAVTTRTLPQRTAKFIETAAKWAPVIKAAGIKIVEGQSVSRGRSPGTLGSGRSLAASG